MANVIIKSPEREARERKILKDFGHDPKRSGAAARELAEHIAEKCHEGLKGGRHA